MLMLFALAGLMFLSMAALVWVDRRRIHREIRMVESRSRFGTNRHKLMTLAVDGKICPRSSTFRTLYVIQTHLMRYPSRYEKLAGRFVFPKTSEAFGTKSISEDLLRESSEWDDEVKELVLDLSASIREFVCDFYWPLRMAIKLERRTKIFSFLTKMARTVLIRESPGISQVEETGDQLRELAQTHAV